MQYFWIAKVYIPYNLSSHSVMLSAVEECVLVLESMDFHIKVQYLHSLCCIESTSFVVPAHPYSFSTQIIMLQ